VALLHSSVKPGKLETAAWARFGSRRAEVMRRAGPHARVVLMMVMPQLPCAVLVILKTAARRRDSGSLACRAVSKTNTLQSEHLIHCTPAAVGLGVFCA
jgi:hypothetical protein